MYDEQWFSALEKQHPVAWILFTAATFAIGQRGPHPLLGRLLLCYVIFGVA